MLIIFSLQNPGGAQIMASKGSFGSKMIKETALANFRLVGGCLGVKKAGPRLATISSAAWRINSRESLSQSDGDRRRAGGPAVPNATETGREYTKIASFAQKSRHPMAHIENGQKRWTGICLRIFIQAIK